jgi:N,N'-diacetyllegionaminate synthase
VTDRVFVIAEAGVNHNGSIELALALVDAAAAAGADAVKFQAFSAERLVSADAPKAGYQLRTTDASESQLEMLRALELGEDALRALIGRCAERGMEFLSSAFDFDHVDMLHRLGMRLFKIPSGEITDLPYLRRVGALGKPVILSTGMADMAEVKAALEVLEAAGTPRDRITVLQCTTEYPAPIEDANLRAMVTMRDEFGVGVGYSDHTPGIYVPLAAVALGAGVIEKHFTLDRALPGPDHAASVEPAELAELVRAIRELEAALGDGAKRPSERELANAVAARKSIVATCDIHAGDSLTADALTTKRPGSGISPMRWDEVVGTRAVRDFGRDELIEL